MAWTNDQTWALVNKPEPEEIRLVDLINKPEPEEIYHHGILGQKWGIRRYQNPDGSLTPEGKKRYSDNIKVIGEFYEGKKGNMDSRLDKYNKAKKALFRDKDLKEDIKNVKHINDKLNLIKDATINEDSLYAETAYKEYLNKHGVSDNDDSKYGFYHFEWGPKNEHYQEALKVYKKQSKELGKEYMNACAELGRKMAGDLADKTYEMNKLEAMYQGKKNTTVTYAETGADFVNYMVSNMSSTDEYLDWLLK